MKEWQKKKLHELLDVGGFINRNAWVSLMIGGVFVLSGTLAESVWAMYAGAILIGAAILMMFAIEIILWYVKWRKKTWK